MTKKQAKQKLTCTCNERLNTRPIVKMEDADGLLRMVHFRQGFICPIPAGHGKSHGKHGLEIIFILAGKARAVDLAIATDWLPVPYVPVNYTDKSASHLFPLPMALGLHSIVPQYEGQEPVGSCWLLDHRFCYCGSSGLASNDLFSILVQQGEQALWAELKRHWDELPHVPGY